MPIRKVLFVTDEIYHVFNRSIYGQDLFKGIKDRSRFLWLIYLSQFKRSFSPSTFFNATRTKKEELLKMLDQSVRWVEIYAYVLMNNHYHFVLRCLVDGGVSKFIGALQNAYANYQRIKYKLKGPLFAPSFKAKIIEDGHIFMHVVRYVFLNPYTGYLIHEPEEIFTYPWSGFVEYEKSSNDITPIICNTRVMMNLFNDDLEQLKAYILDQKDYQRELNRIKHVVLE